MDNNTLLTKSDFLLFLEAPRHLWADKHDLIDKTPSPFERNVMRQGYEVEALGKEYLEKYELKPLCVYNGETTPVNNLECKAEEKKHVREFER